MSKVNRISKLLSILFFIPAISILLFTIFSGILDFMPGPGSFGYEKGFYYNVAENAAWDLNKSFSSFLHTIFPNILLIFVFYFLSRLFNLYAKGSYFKDQNIACYKWIGWSLIGHFVISLIISFTQGNYDGGSNNFSFDLDLTSLSFNYLIYGVVILCISWVFNEAKKIEEEHQLVV